MQLQHCNQTAAGESENNGRNGRVLQRTATPPIADATTISNNRGLSLIEKVSVPSEIRQQDLFQNHQQVSRDVTFSLDGKFLVQPLFLQVIRKVNGVDPSKVIFTYKEVSRNTVVVRLFIKTNRWENKGNL